MDIQAALEDALSELHTIAERAELQESCYPIHVDFGTLVKFDSPTWEVIFGSPGSGKTILFKSWEEAVYCLVERPRVLPLYISAKQLRGAPGGESSPEARAEAHFVAFLEEFATQVELATGKVRTQRSSVDPRRGDRAFRKQAKAVAGLLAAIRDAVEHGRPVRRPRQATHQEERASEKQRRTRVGIGIFARLGALLGLGVHGRAERSRSTMSASRERLRRESEMEPHFAKARKHLEELADVLEIERFCVLLDDWSAVDSRVQPWLAEWLLHSFDGNRRVVFKIATNRNNTRLRDDSREVGFKLGEDLRNAGALDHPLMSEADLVAFFEILLLKRLVSLRNDLADFFVEDRLGRPKPEFVASMFSTSEAFETLATGTEGIPRTFLAALSKLVDNGLPRGGWTVDEVQDVIGAPELPLEAPDLFVDEITQTELIYQYVIRHTVVTTGSRYFLVRVEDREVARDAMLELLELELIHRDTSSVLPEQLHDYFDGYWLSEDAWRSFGRPRLYKQGLVEGDAEGPTEGWLNPRPPRIDSLESAQPYVLDFTQWH